MAQDEKINQINADVVHSAQMDEIMTRVPGWIIRIGSTVIFVFIIALLVLSWFIKYPDIVPGKVQIMKENAGTIQHAKQSGQFAWLVDDNEYVEIGTPIGYLLNTAKYEDILKLKNAIYKNPKAVLRLPRNLELGAINHSFDIFKSRLKKEELGSKNIENYNDIKEGYRERKRALELSMRESKLQYQEIHKLGNRQITNLKKRYYPLLKEGAISKIEFERFEKEYKATRQQELGLKNQILEIKNQISRLKEQDIRANYNKDEIVINSKVAAENAITTLKKDILNWEEQFLIKATDAGVFKYSWFEKNHKLIESGTAIGRIYSDTTNANLFAIMQISTENAGKIKPNQKVLISLSHYNKKEFGQVEGSVLELKPFKNKGFTIKINLPKGLVTTSEKELSYSENLIGEGRIITKDLRLFHRFFYQLYDLFDS